MTITAPEPIGPEHDLQSFSSGDDILDEWLRLRSRKNQVAGASRTYVVCDPRRVVGFYTLASSALATTLATGRFRRNMPEPIPVALLGRLAVDRDYRGQGLGRALFKDAARRVLAAASSLAIRGLIVHAISEEAAAFYQALG